MRNIAHPVGIIATGLAGSDEFRCATISSIGSTQVESRMTVHFVVQKTSSFLSTICKGRQFTYSLLNHNQQEIAQRYGGGSSLNHILIGLDFKASSNFANCSYVEGCYAVLYLQYLSHQSFEINSIVFCQVIEVEAFKGNSYLAYKNRKYLGIN